MPSHEQAELAAWHSLRSSREAAPETIGKQVRRLIGDLSGNAKPMSPEDQRQARRKFWVRQFRAYNTDLEDKHPARVWAAWRVTTVLGRLKGYLTPKETLSTASAEKVAEDLWTKPARPMVSKRPKELALAAAFDDINEVGRELSIMPPPVPEGWLEVEDVKGRKVSFLKDGYDPTNFVCDNDYVRWFDTVERLVDFLGIYGGTADCPELGMVAMEGLNNPNYLRALWPTMDELRAMDREVLDFTEEAVARNGVKGAEKELKREYGLLSFEALAIIESAKNSLVENFYDDNTARAILDRQFDDIASRAQEACALPSELAARRMQMRLRGLEAMATEDRNKDVLDALREITAGRNEDGTPAGSNPAVPQIEVERIE